MKTLSAFLTFSAAFHWSLLDSQYKAPVMESCDVLLLLFVLLSFLANYRVAGNLRHLSSLIGLMWRHYNDIYIFLQMKEVLRQAGLQMQRVSEAFNWHRM